MNVCIDEKDEERERARLSRDGEGRTPLATRSRDARRARRGGQRGRVGAGGARTSLWAGVECAPLAVTAEPRSLSLFIFFVDANVHGKSFLSFAIHKEHF